MKERFTEEEWKSVETAFEDGVFRVLLAAGDESAGKRELGQLVEDLILARSSSPDPLLREVATSEWAEAKATLFDESTGVSPTSPSASRIAEIKELLHAKLSNEEYESYFTTVLFEALMLAKTEGDPGHEVSADEAKALSAFARDWEIDLAPIWQRMADWRS
jgi:hypothetical protein